MAKKDLTFREQIEELYPEDDFMEIPDNDPVESISTGSPSLDVSIGIGGVPIGRFTEIFGPESSSKTTLCLSISKNAIAKGKKVLYIDQEQGLDYKYIEAITGEVFDSNTFSLYQPETSEQSLGIAEVGIRSGEFGLIVVDSIGALAPSKEKEDDLEKAHISLIPRQLSAFLRRNAYAIKHQNIAFIFVNQIRDKIGSFIPNQFDRPGGHALKHFESLAISLWKSTNIIEGVKDDEKTVGIIVRFTISKNKLARPFRGWTFPMYFGKGIDSTRDLIDFGVFLHILEKRGPYIIFGDMTLGQGMVKSKAFLENNQETLDKLILSVYNYDIKESEVMVDNSTP